MRQASDSDRKRHKSYRKEIVEQNSGSKMKDKFVNLTYNLTYTIGGGLNRLKSFMSSDTSKQHVIFYLHGNKFSNEAEAQAYIKKIIWFSYRRIPGLSKQIHCDTGWGCLIRVGQMALAAGLKKHLESKKGQKFLTYQQIVIAFVENGGKQQKYSLKKIVEEANKKYGLNYGDWFKPPQICDVLVSLHKKDPMRGAQNLQIHHFKDSAVYLDTIFSKLNKPMCNCTKRRILCENCIGTGDFRDQKSIESFSSSSFYEPKKPQPNLQYKMRLTLNSDFKETKTEKKMLFFVSSRLGFEKINQNDYNQLMELLKLQCSLGIIGGVPRKGYYFVGCVGNQLIYMDPHYVQDQITLSKLQYLIRTFENKELRKVSQSEVDPSMSFVFYIDSLEALRKFYNKIEEFNNEQNQIMIVKWENDMKTDEFRIEEEEDDFNGDLENSFIQEL